MDLSNACNGTMNRYKICICTHTTVAMSFVPMPWSEWNVLAIARVPEAVQEDGFAAGQRNTSHKPTMHITHTQPVSIW